MFEHIWGQFGLFQWLEGRYWYLVGRNTLEKICIEQNHPALSNGVSTDKQMLEKV